MATKKISVTVDADVLSRIQRILPENFNLSAVVNEALHDQLKRYEALAVLDAMERERPISADGKIAGERLWQAIESSLTPEPSARLPNVICSDRRIRKRVGDGRTSLMAEIDAQGPVE